MKVREHIEGTKIENFEFDFSNPFTLDEEFTIDLSKSVFSFAVKSDISKYYFNAKEFTFNESVIKCLPSLYCYDNRDVPFTLYNCYITPKQVPIIKEVEVIWNFMIYGAHIESLDDYQSNCLESVVESDKKTYRLLFGKEEFSIKNIDISMDWHSSDDVFDGVIIIIKSMDSIPFNELYDLLLRSLEFMCFQAGYFAYPLIIKTTYNDKTIEYISPHKGLPVC